MQCPCCKKEKPAHPEVCALCGYDPAIPYEPPTSKASKTARLSFALAILSFFTFLITAIPAIIFACIALRQISRSPDRLKGRRLAIAGIVITLAALPLVPIVLYSLWRLDAPPIPNDYTIADLRSAPADCAESFELLMSICDEDDEIATVVLSEREGLLIDELREIFRDEDESKIAETLRHHEEGLVLAWNRTKEVRGVVVKLAEFDEIADLSKPSVGSELAPTNLIDLTRLIRAYSYLQADRDILQVPLKELGELNTVVGKLATNARSHLAKLTCFVCMLEAIRTMNTLANNPDVPQASIEFAGDYFAPLKSEVLSLRNSALSEYLLIKRVIVEVGPDELGPGGLPMLKRNSTLRLYRNYCDRILATLEDAETEPPTELNVWPTAYGGLASLSYRHGRALPFMYRCYNPGGVDVCNWRAIHMNREKSKSIKMGIQDDLLQIVLNKRLGKPVSLKARAYGDEYIVDVEGKKIFSPGPDGKTGTKDDISLPINPEVLGW